MKSQSRQGGFTLIEMMMVVALIAILAAIAIPAYNNYVNRAKIKTAQADLVALSLNFENAYQRQLAYPAGPFANTGALTSEFKGWNPASDTAEFGFTATVGTPTGGYTLTATGAVGGVSGCAISLTSDGTKTISSCSYASDGDWL